IVTEDCIRCPLQAGDKHGVIKELVDLLAGHGKVGDPEAVTEAVWTREQTKTTGIGLGLAIPHGKHPSMGDLAIAIGKPATPIDFEAIDKKPVQLIVLLVSPTSRMADHIDALAQVSRLMNNEAFRESIYAADTPAEIFNLMREGAPV
ncbi:MAG: PTS sugar transporter subunit IIA, partial [Planctomycetota bacterium]